MALIWIKASVLAFAIEPCTALVTMSEAASKID